ncbi:hypothetical protein [Spirosoma gilvum]
MEESTPTPNEYSVTADQLQAHRTVEAPSLKRLSRSQLVKQVADLTAKARISLETNPPLMELTARHPYQDAGFMDFYRPGRWDCESNLVFMEAIRQTGPSPGQWEGTVGYLRFKAPKAGTYLIVINFTGYQITMNLSGPWGTNTAYSPTTSSTGVATAIWTGTKGAQVFFTISCKGGIMGYLQSAQVFLI